MCLCIPLAIQLQIDLLICSLVINTIQFMSIWVLTPIAIACLEYHVNLCVLYNSSASVLDMLVLSGDNTKKRLYRWSILPNIIRGVISSRNHHQHPVLLHFLRQNMLEKQTGINNICKWKRPGIWELHECAYYLKKLNFWTAVFICSLCDLSSKKRTTRIAFGKSVTRRIWNSWVKKCTLHSTFSCQNAVQVHLIQFYLVGKQ